MRRVGCWLLVAACADAWLTRRNPRLLCPSRSRRVTAALSLSDSSMDAQSPVPPQVEEVFLDELLNVAVQAAKKAGNIIMGNNNADGAQVAATNKANSRDLLTQIDPLCEATIRETILAHFSGHAFLGEEDVPPGKLASTAALENKLATVGDNWLWIVDPIDGTTNFVHGMPLCMPSIAATYQGHVMVAVIFDCHRNELYTAIRGQGTKMNNKPIRVDPIPTALASAVVAMGSPPADESMQMSIKGVQALMPQVRTLRMLGSAALMLAWVAQGRLTAYWEYDLSSWDIAAGALLVTEGGGNFTDLAGRDYTLATRKICASNGLIHDELLGVLRDEAGIV